LPVPLLNINTIVLNFNTINYESELEQNGYEILRGNSLQEFKIAAKKQYVDEIDFIGKSLHNISTKSTFVRE